MQLLPYFFFLLVLGTGVRAQSADGFSLESEEDGVRVYIRTEDNDEMSVRVVTRTTAELRRVRATLDDAESYPEWVHRCDGAYIVPGGTANDYLYVSGIDLPFPFRDKEVVARVQQTVGPQSVFRRTIRAEPTAVPPNAGRDRLQVYFGEWVVRPLSRGVVELQCTVRTDAGAGLPGWLRREILTNGPAKTVSNLRDRLEATP
ncbi:hypothetical protein GGR26_001267 [Lewinella marina]|uniref:Coenzyme Q-binding protein COQ10 START domain-containing protein n=1 Tax=Neolewinella marina TaxID=438751 RepID=A0A2G0CFN6_9BACT|nr:SRPBCC family protein [Neolewinella marina]NJB85522.1 hypothetical protein [Neolewinella marina]PHK98789.1 hypothetical protein CGL56_10020 [Neolewinella marina]